jgi:peptide/nickel transport system substrate-binding protein
VNRRAALRLLALGGAGGAMVLVAACAPASPAAPTAPAKPAAATQPAAIQPKRGGTLRAAITADLANLEPHVILPNAYESLWLAFDRLTAYDANLKPQPQLAETWEFSSDFKQLKLNLRKGVQFHNGREFTSDDVKWNILRVRDPKVGASVGFRNPSNWFSSIDTPDKYTAVLTTDVPHPTVFDMFEYFNMIDRETAEGPNAKTTAMGTGPFAFGEWAQGDHLSFKRNPNYWQSGKPYLDEVRVSILPDLQAQVTQLESGAIDLIKTPPLRDFIRLKSDAKYQTVLHPNSAQHFLLGANTLVPPLDNKQVRQALSYAADRKRFAESVLLGTSQPESLPWLPSSPAYEPTKQIPFDLDKAKSLLAAAGASNFSLDIYPFIDFQELFDFCLIYQADLATLGITLNVKRVDLTNWLDQVNNRKYGGLYVTINTLAQMEPVTMLTQGRAYDPTGNNSGYKNERYEQLIAAAQTEPDLQKRKQVYSQLNDLILDESFSMTLASSPPRLAVRSALMGLGYTLHEAFSYTDAWLAG